MFSLKCSFVLLSTCLILVSSNPIEWNEIWAEEFDSAPLLRQVRSPQHGSVNIEYGQDQQRGREATIQYNHNLFTISDGRGTIDAYAKGSRNFYHNRNDFGGGIQAKWNF
ncbi:uncharacterized protein LOC142240190 [Haematobia irritans]|uniref:uncharacterized protein LOC142240190 n=1 Tax=Haematobia irritans TaxID=7368 RepID=UPI003F508E14